MPVYSSLLFEPLLLREMEKVVCVNKGYVGYDDIAEKRRIKNSEEITC